MKRVCSYFLGALNLLFIALMLWGRYFLPSGSVSLRGQLGISRSQPLAVLEFAIEHGMTILLLVPFVLLVVFTLRRSLWGSVPTWRWSFGTNLVLVLVLLVFGFVDTMGFASKATGGMFVVYLPIAGLAVANSALLLWLAPQRQSSTTS